MLQGDFGLIAVAMFECEETEKAALDTGLRVKAVI
jgi:hypothetical protein